MTADRPEITPVDNDGVLVVSIGTAVWLVGLVGSLIFRADLRDDARGREACDE